MSTVKKQWLSNQDFLSFWARYNHLTKGDRSELKKVRDLNHLELLPVTYDLLPSNASPQEIDNWLRLIYLLPYITHVEGAPSLGKHLSIKKINEMRLFQLVRSEHPNDYKYLRRLLVYIGKSSPLNVDITKFGPMVFYWNEATKRQLVRDYYTYNLKENEQ